MMKLSNNGGRSSGVHVTHLHSVQDRAPGILLLEHAVVAIIEITEA